MENIELFIDTAATPAGSIAHTVQAQVIRSGWKYSKTVFASFSQKEARQQLADRKQQRDAGNLDYDSLSDVWASFAANAPKWVADLKPL